MSPTAEMAAAHAHALDLHTRLQAECRSTSGSRPAAARVFGRGVRDIVSRFDELERRTRRTVFNMQPQFPFDPRDPGTDLNARSRARGVRLALIVTPAAIAGNPLLVASEDDVRVGVAPVPLLIVDGQLVVFGGPPTLDGAVTAWQTTDRTLVSTALDVWDEAYACSPPVEVHAGPHSLTPRHVAVARALCRGEKDDAIAHHLGTSSRSVQRLVSDLGDHLGVKSRPEIVAALGVRAR